MFYMHDTTVLHYTEYAGEASVNILKMKEKVGIRANIIKQH